jgi:hypothetical protein
MAISLLSILCYFFLKRRCKLASRRTRDLDTGAINHYNAQNNLNSMKTEDMDALWVVREGQDGSEFDDDFDETKHNASAYQAPYVINDFLKQKYIYSKSNSTLEKLREDMHIERLKNELKSVL